MVKFDWAIVTAPDAYGVEDESTTFVGVARHCAWIG